MIHLLNTRESVECLFMLVIKVFHMSFVSFMSVARTGLISLSSFSNGGHFCRVFFSFTHKTTCPTAHVATNPSTSLSESLPLARTGTGRVSDVKTRPARRPWQLEATQSSKPIDLCAGNMDDICLEKNLNGEKSHKRSARAYAADRRPVQHCGGAHA
ncbi:hypothetical protein Y032_0367g24 [Ancylostoma ceylanicum]|nr:hypothetical protein Y032_0367g24 [Ancylostoma ceylanicum]